MSCEYCKDRGTAADNHGTDCCWSRAMEIFKFRRRVLHKYILGSIFDMLISITSVTTDIIAIALYLYKDKLGFALLTLIPVLLPTLVFTNVYLTDESDKKRKKPASKIVSIIGHTTSNPPGEKAEETSTGENYQLSRRHSSSSGESVETGSTDSSIRDLDKRTKCRRDCLFHWACCSSPLRIMRNCFRGCLQCFCQRDHHLRRMGARTVKNSIQKMFKYGFGTFVLRFIAWAWYMKALLFGIKAFRQPKRYLKIETPDNHWSYQLLVRLDFLQAALENAPQCCVQLYALVTQPDEDIALGLLTLFFSFIDFIRIIVSVHWDMNKGPVTAPTGCYDTWIWKCVNTFSWIFIYMARASAIALILAMSGYKSTKTILPAAVFTLHIILFAKILSKVEYGVAGQKVIVATFISLFFLPELDSSVMPAIVQFYYAMIIFQNTFFIIPWDGFDGGLEYCISSSGIGPPPTPRTPIVESPIENEWEYGKLTPGPPGVSSGIRHITQPPIPDTTSSHNDCLIDPTILTLAVPTLTVIGVILRLASSQKMVSYKQTLPCNMQERDLTQHKLEASITNLFSKQWSQMSFNQMLSAFFRMLKKEVVVVNEHAKNDDKANQEVSTVAKNKKYSFMSDARLQADFLASQTFIRESFSLMTRTTRSHDINIGSLFEGNLSEEGDAPPDYNSDSELTLRVNSNLKKRPRLPKSRNVSESMDGQGPELKTTSAVESTFVQVELPSGSHNLEMCWV